MNTIWSKEHPKYAVHTFQRQIMKNVPILTDNELENKVVYFKKLQNVIKFQQCNVYNIEWDSDYHYLALGLK